MKLLWLVEGMDVKEVPTKRISGDTGWCYVLDRAEDDTPHYAKMGVDLFYDRGTAIKDLLDNLHIRQEHGEEFGDLIEQWREEFRKERGKGYLFLPDLSSGDDGWNSVP